MIRNLIATKKIDEMLVEALQAEISQNKATFKKEMSCTFEEHANEVKSWKEDLDKVMNNHRILEDKYRNLLASSPRTTELVPSRKIQHSGSTSVQDSPLEICYDETTFHAPDYCICPESASGSLLRSGGSENLAEVDAISNSI